MNICLAFTQTLPTTWNGLQIACIKRGNKAPWIHFEFPLPFRSQVLTYNNSPFKYFFPGWLRRSFSALNRWKISSNWISELGHRLRPWTFAWCLHKHCQLHGMGSEYLVLNKGINVQANAWACKTVLNPRSSKQTSQLCQLDSKYKVSNKGISTRASTYACKTTRKPKLQIKQAN